MSDRIVIMTPHPGRIERAIGVALPRPRQRNRPEFLQLRGGILELLHLAGTPSRAGVAGAIRSNGGNEAPADRIHPRSNGQPILGAALEPQHREA
jgi:hypothetical protein